MNSVLKQTDFLFPDDIFNKILSINMVSVRYEQTVLVNKILSYYTSKKILNGNLVKRQELKKLMIKALKFDYCIYLLNHNKYFNRCFNSHQDGRKCYCKMEWIESLIISILMCIV